MVASPHQLPAETLHASDLFAARRFGRHLVVELLTVHRVLSTSARRGGQQDELRYLVNHQSCEARGDVGRMELINRLGLVGYHDHVCSEMGVDPENAAVMGTAANMAYAAHRWAEFEDIRADAFVTAGVSGNAARASDPAKWAETGDGWRKLANQGTINTILLLNCPITAPAQVRAVVTMTEAKSAALAELAVPSRYSPTIATGTGTDQFCLAAPLDPRRKARASTSPHVKLGEIIGVAVKDATKEALRWQNGLEPSYIRGLFHALGRFGLTEERALSGLAELLPEAQHTLLRKNRKAVFFEPGVAAAAYAFAAVLDRIAFGTLPSGMAKESLRQQAASLACSLAARPQDWPLFRRELAESDEEPDDPMDLVVRALALGWKSKWT